MFLLVLVAYYRDFISLWTNNNIPLAAAILSSLISGLIAAFGWYVTSTASLEVQHKNQVFAIQAQNLNLINQIVNNARIEIAKAISKQELWLSDLYNYIYYLDSTIKNPTTIWADEKSKYEELLQRRSIDWLVLVEENKLLFHETSSIMPEFGVREKNIDNYAKWVRKLLWEQVPNDENSKMRAYSEIERELAYIDEQLALLQHLKAYLQNKALGRILGSTVVPVEPPDISDSARIELDETGNLRIISTAQHILIRLEIGGKVYE
jgi:hypothetical protein